MLAIQPDGANDPWISLKTYTTARIALGRTGAAIPLKEVLQFRLAHAYAKDAVFSTLDKDVFARLMEQMALGGFFLQSKVKDRNEYLKRPDLGRSLNDASSEKLQSIAVGSFDVVIVVADGLSASAVNTHAQPLLTLLLPILQSEGIAPAPMVFVEQGRVAIADEIGYLLKARLSLILIGERPGLSSPHSMGAYLTYGPRPGLTDECRNCISNINNEGLSYEEAMHKIVYLIKASLHLQLSGIGLKDDQHTDIDTTNLL